MTEAAVASILLTRAVPTGGKSFPARAEELNPEGFARALERAQQPEVHRSEPSNHHVDRDRRADEDRPASDDRRTDQGARPERDHRPQAEPRADDERTASHEQIGQTDEDPKSAPEKPGTPPPEVLGQLVAAVANDKVATPAPVVGKALAFDDKGAPITGDEALVDEPRLQLEATPADPDSRLQNLLAALMATPATAPPTAPTEVPQGVATAAAVSAAQPAMAAAKMTDIVKNGPPAAQAHAQSQAAAQQASQSAAQANPANPANAANAARSADRLPTASALAARAAMVDGPKSDDEVPALAIQAPVIEDALGQAPEAPVATLDPTARPNDRTVEAAPPQVTAIPVAMSVQDLGPQAPAAPRDGQAARATAVKAIEAAHATTGSGETATKAPEKVLPGLQALPETARADVQTTASLEPSGRLQMAEPLSRAITKLLPPPNTTNRQRVIEMRLDPPSLGTIRVRVEEKAGEVHAHFVVPNERVERLVNAEISRLTETLAQQGISLGSTSVQTGGGGRQQDQQAQREAVLMAASHRGERASAGVPSPSLPPLPTRADRVSSGRVNVRI